MKKSSILYLQDMLESISKIRSYTKGMCQNNFLQDEKTRDAVIRQITIIGKAANRIEQSIKN